MTSYAVIFGIGLGCLFLFQFLFNVLSIYLQKVTICPDLAGFILMFYLVLLRPATILKCPDFQSNTKQQNSESISNDSKIIKFINFSISEDSFSEILKIPQFFFSLPAHNAILERIFSLIKIQWSEERNNLDLLRRVDSTEKYKQAEKVDKCSYVSTIIIEFMCYYYSFNHNTIPE